MTRPVLRRPSSWGIWLLAALTYLPSLAAAPGRMPTDTKLYLYLNPARLIADAPFSWDNRQFAGWVPHQTIAYLWPSGPWFWVFDKLGVPDWIAHRLWIGTILFLGGLGVRWAARHLGLASSAATVAGLVYALSPYILPYVSRTSVMLLPWAGVGWLVGLTVRATTRTRWRDAALFAMVVLTIGAVNATALALIAPAPVLWLVHAAWARTITWRTALITAAKVGSLSLLVSLWWIVMLSVQGKHGADVLAFSETLEAVSFTSLSTETLRGLGYWLFYVRDPYAFTTTASLDYMTGSSTIIAGYALTAICLFGLAIVRWSQRRFAALLVVVGIVLAVGVHPIGGPSPLMRPVASSALGLALRSSTRALPLVIFGLALGAGALVSSLSMTRWRARSLAAPAVVMLAIVNLPALWHGGFVDPALERDQNVPAAWSQAAASLDASSPEYRVLQLPGSEFGAFRWGYTVDPPLPGLTDKPLVTRDLLPLGSPGAMDLLYALDNRFQNGTIEPASIAAIARYLGSDTIWVANDLAFERFRTPRPEVVADLFAHPIDGLTTPRPFGTPSVNQPLIDMTDEQQLSDPRLGTALAPVELVDVASPVPIVRAGTDLVVVSGSGDGLVDAAAAGLLHGNEVIIYAADLARANAAMQRGTSGAAGAASASGQAGSADAALIVTDTNRDRAMMWRGSQDTTGFTETGGPAADVTRSNSADQRLAVFPDQTAANQTIAVLDDVTGAPSNARPFTVSASAYGDALGYRPEDRAAMAVDGDPSTAWRVADRGDPIGESISLSTTDGTLHLLQPQRTASNRVISRIRIDIAAPGNAAGTPPLSTVLADLDERSLTTGQDIDLGPDTAGRAVTITIVTVDSPASGTDPGPSAVGFAEIGPVAHEVIRPPTDQLSQITEATPLAIVLSRDRVRATDRFRSDPEAAMRRTFALPVARTVTPTFTLRLDARSTDAVLDALQRTPTGVIASGRLAGVTGARGAAAVDGDPTTAWTTPFGEAVGSSLTVPLDPATSIDHLTLAQPLDEIHSTISKVRIAIGTLDAEFDVPPPDPAGQSFIAVPAAAGSQMTITINAVTARTTIERRYGEVTELPAAITEIGGFTGPALTAAPTTTPPVDNGCLDDLVTLDGVPVSLAVGRSEVDRLLGGEAVDVGLCEGDRLDLAATDHLLVTNGGSDAATTTGIDVDRITLRSNLDGTSMATTATGSSTSATSAPTAPTVSVTRTRTTRTATVGACPSGCWLVLGEGFNPSWNATDGTTDLGAPTQVSGGFNGWWLPASAATRTVTMNWTPQRSLNIALTIAGAGVLACLLLAILDRRRRAPILAIGPPHWDGSLGVIADRNAALLAGAVLVVGSAAVIAPSWGVLAVVPAAALIIWRRLRWCGLAAALLTAGLGATVLMRQRLERWMPESAWVEHFDDLHRFGLLVVVLLLAGSLATERDA